MNTHEIILLGFVIMSCTFLLWIGGFLLHDHYHTISTNRDFNSDDIMNIQYQIDFLESELTFVRDNYESLLGLSEWVEMTNRSEPTDLCLMIKENHQIVCLTIGEEK